MLAQLGKSLGGRDRGEDKIGVVPRPINRSRAQDTNGIWSNDLEQ